MSYENLSLFVQGRKLGSGMGLRRGRCWMALGLWATALLLLGCTAGQVTADEVRQTHELSQAEGRSQGGEQMVEELGEIEPLDEESSSSSWMNLAQVLPVTAQVELGGEQFDLEVTRTPEEQALGLMYREKLADDRGMLFSFEPARPVRFWMKNVVINLDMIFVHDGAIVGIAADVPPCEAEPCATYGPGLDVLVDEVIELRGGRAAELGLALGDAVNVKPLALNEPGDS